MQPFSDITGACQMNTRSRCIAPDPSIGNWRASSANWREPASSQDRGGAYCGSQCRSIAEPPISTARPRVRALRDRRNARMDVVAACRALGIRDVAAGAQTLNNMAGRVQPGIISRFKAEKQPNRRDAGTDYSAGAEGGLLSDPVTRQNNSQGFFG